jgi:twitching motility two-component system response regulator PilG
MVLRRTPPPQSRAAAPGAAAAASQQTQAAPATPANRAKKISDRVLVVDDNATVRHFMEVKLAPFGFGVDFAESGEEAIGLTGENEYTCIFLDVVLPGIDGFQVCKLIKSNKQAIKRTAIVMLTGRTSTFDKMRGTLAGCDEYLTKPVDENRLLEVMAKFLPLPAAATV